MIEKELLRKLNEQIRFEFYSGYYYLSMAAYCDSMGMSGAAHFFKVQAKEEYEHGMKIYDHIYERGENVTLQKIDQPKTEFKSLLEIFELSYQHEQSVSAMIFGLVDLSREKRDYMTERMLDWFINEQVEEENNMLTLLERLKMIGDNKNGLIMFDKELAKRGE